jgi:hypothetical protein
MSKTSSHGTDDLRRRLTRAQERDEPVRLLRSIDDADVLKGFVVAVGRKWGVVAALDARGIDGSRAFRVNDLKRIEPSYEGTFRRRLQDVGSGHRLARRTRST